MNIEDKTMGLNVGKVVLVLTGLMFAVIIIANMVA